MLIHLYELQYAYIYIYIHRERERERLHLYHIHLCLYITNCCRRTQSVAYQEAVLRSGDNDLTINFFNSDNHPEMKHRVKVYLGDNMHELVEKVALACMAQDRNERDPEVKEKLKAARAKLSSEDFMVMVFQPSEDLRRQLASEARMSGRGSVQSAMLGRSQELLRRLQSERLNPSSWQPLESVKTFKDFAKYFDAEASRVTLRIADINGVRKGTNGVSTDGDTASFAMTYFPNLSAFLLILQRCHWC